MQVRRVAFGTVSGYMCRPLPSSQTEPSAFLANSPNAALFCVPGMHFKHSLLSWSRELVRKVQDDISYVVLFRTGSLYLVT